MRLSREKINHLSIQIVDGMAAVDSITFLQPHNDIRLEVVDVMRSEMEHIDQIENTIRERILSMKKDIPEGSEEWHVLFEKMYREETEKEGKLR